MGYIYIMLLVLLLPKQMCFAKQLLLLYLVDHEKLLVVLAKCLKNLLEAVHF